MTVDKGYAGHKSRRALQRRGTGAIISRLVSEPGRGVRLDRVVHPERYVVGSTIHRLTQDRAIVSSREKLKETYHALVTAAAIILWL